MATVVQKPAWLLRKEAVFGAPIAPERVVELSKLSDAAEEHFSGEVAESLTRKITAKIEAHRREKQAAYMREYRAKRKAKASVS